MMASDTGDEKEAGPLSTDSLLCNFSDMANEARSNNLSDVEMGREAILPQFEVYDAPRELLYGQWPADRIVSSAEIFMFGRQSVPRYPYAMRMNYSPSCLLGQLDSIPMQQTVRDIGPEHVAYLARRSFVEPQDILDAYNVTLAYEFDHTRPGRQWRVLPFIDIRDRQYKKWERAFGLSCVSHIQMELYWNWISQPTAYQNALFVFFPVTTGVHPNTHYELYMAVPSPDQPRIYVFDSLQSNGPFTVSQHRQNINGISRVLQEQIFPGLDWSLDTLGYCPVRFKHQTNTACGIFVVKCIEWVLQRMEHEKWSSSQDAQKSMDSDEQAIYRSISESVSDVCNQTATIYSTIAKTVNDFDLLLAVFHIHEGRKAAGILIQSAFERFMDSVARPYYHTIRESARLQNWLTPNIVWRKVSRVSCPRRDNAGLYLEWAGSDRETMAFREASRKFIKERIDGALNRNMDPIDMDGGYRVIVALDSHSSAWSAEPNDLLLSRFPNAICLYQGWEPAHSEEDEEDAKVDSRVFRIGVSTRQDLEQTIEAIKLRLLADSHLNIVFYNAGLQPAFVDAITDAVNDVNGILQRAFHAAVAVDYQCREEKRKRLDHDDSARKRFGFKSFHRFFPATCIRFPLTGREARLLAAATDTDRAATKKREDARAELSRILATEMQQEEQRVQATVEAKKMRKRKRDSRT